VAEEDRVVEKLADVIARFGQKALERRGEGRPSASERRAALLPDRHPTRDFFIADILDWALKDDRHSMEHPMFSLSKKPDRRIRHYEHNGNSITIAPGAYGLATIWDKDILIYLISHIIEGLNQGREDAKSRKIRFRAYDYLVSTNRPVGGEHYKRLEAGLDRLKGTSIKTNILTGGARIKHGFGLIDDWKIIEKSPTDGRMIAVEVTLSEWLYNAIAAREVLTLNRDYFRLGGALERRLYELARKHCGNQARWAVRVELLHRKSGSASPLKRFRHEVKRIAVGDDLPGYRMNYEPDGDQVTFYTKGLKALAASLARGE
jgi:plasmid replication initiation protein